MSDPHPLHELIPLVDRELWLLRQVMNATPDSTATPYTPPAEAYLSLLKDAVGKLREARDVAQSEIHRNLWWKLTQEVRGKADAVETMAQHEPEIRRYWLLDSLVFACDQGVRFLETEGKPPPKRFPAMNYEDLP